MFIDELRNVDLSDVKSCQRVIAKFGSELDSARSRVQSLESSVNSLLDIMAANGGIYVYCWQRDCDCVDFDSVDKMDSREAYEKYCEEAYQHAEGPVRISVISREEFEAYQPYQRDHITEAFENGNGSRVIID